MSLKGEPIPQYESAIQRGRASYLQVVETDYHRFERYNQDDESRRKHKHYHPLIVQAFEKSYGGILCSFESPYIIASCVLTQNGYFDCVCPFKNGTDAENKIRYISMLYAKANRFLRGEDRKECAEGLYEACTHLLQIVGEESICTDQDSQENCKMKTNAKLLNISSLLENVQNRIEINAQKNAQIDYFMGMLIGCFFLFLSAYIMQFFLTSYREIVGAIIGGSLGAFVSVMTRMTKRELVLEYDVGRFLIFLFGAFRPLIGGILGSAIWCLIAGKLLPIEVKTDNSFLYYSGIGFIAGFSERWAQDMLGTIHLMPRSTQEKKHI